MVKLYNLFKYKIIYKHIHAINHNKFTCMIMFKYKRYVQKFCRKNQTHMPKFVKTNQKIKKNKFWMKHWKKKTIWT